MPAQPGDDAGTLGDQVFTMVDQQPQLTLDAIQARDGQIRIARESFIPESCTFSVDAFHAARQSRQHDVDGHAR